MKSLIAIPCFNCQNQVTRVIESLLAEELYKTNEILLIDNVSTDNTLQRIKDKIKAYPQFMLIQNNSNYGLGGSHKIAFQYAIENNFDFVTILHGDDQARVTDYEKLLDVAKKTKHPALGSRFMIKSKRIGYQRSRTFGNIVLNIIFTIVTFRLTKDLGSGINVFSTSDLKKINFKELTNSFNFNVELLLNLYSKNIPLSFLPITWVEEDQISNAKNLNVAFSMLKSLFLWRFGLTTKQQGQVYSFRKIT
jgi:dolichol-phosphate mannosyltransferase